MEFIVNNWYIIIALLAVLVVAIVAVITFCKLPTATQIANVKEWLKWAVTEAEKELGTGTGQLKLRMVYDMAVAQFDWIAKFVSFDTFSGWVDEALQWLEKQLFTNDNVKKIVKGENYGK